jgi:hypothetical protein
MNSKHFIRLFTVLFLAANFVLLVPSYVSIVAAQEQKFSATVEPLGGLVQIKAAGQSGWQTIDKVTLLKQGDQVRTGDTGAAELNTVTGIHVDIYPSSLISLRTLSLGETDNVLTFQLNQVVGLTHVTVDRALKDADVVEVTTPAMIASVHGTKFFVFVSHNSHSVVVGDEDIVSVDGITRENMQNGANDATYFQVSFNQTPPVVTCTVDFLNKFAVGVKMQDLSSDSGKKLFKDFLTEYFASNVNDKSTGLVAKLLNAPSSSTSQDLVDAIDTFDGAVELSDFLPDFRSALADYFSAMSSVPQAPATCGNGKTDNGETAENCGADAADISAISGNGLCETVKGESLINSPKDCLSFANAAQSCVDVLNANRPTLPGLGGGPGVGGGNPPAQVPTNVPATFSGGGVTPPQPSGVGNNP